MSIDDNWGLYFMVIGTAPFHGLSPKETLAAHLGKVPQVPSTRLGARVPYDLEQTIARCLAKKPGDRYPNMRELEEALAACAGRRTMRATSGVG